jgi:hypothetical protein
MTESLGVRKVDPVPAPVGRPLTIRGLEIAWIDLLFAC